MAKQKIPGKRGFWGGIWLGGHRTDVVWTCPNRNVSRGDRGGVRGLCEVVLADNFLIESKISSLVRGGVSCVRTLWWGYSYFSMRPKLRIYLIGAYENLSCRFAPKTAPKRVWNGSAPYSTLLYTWDKTCSEPWYAIPPNPTKQHCNARFLYFS